MTAAKAFALVVNEPRVPSVFTCADTPIDPKCSTPPPGYTAPPPSRYPVRTSAEVLAGPATDPFVGPVASDVAFGAPLFVKALRPSDHDEWLVPVVRGAEA